MRTCLVCRSRRSKGSLLRLAMDPGTGLIVLDHLQRLPGRGAYVCAKCLPEIRTGHRARRAFRGRARGLSDELTGSRDTPG
ncbi:MAG: YlxR family protein [Syntrophobacteraceae bacterium]|nr:YlxR family protein [Syntrophobacteraceae bacterium]